MGLFDLSGKIAIVTGGNQGIGFAIAKNLAEAGAVVIIANRRASECKKAADSLTNEGLRAIGIPTDVADNSSITAMVSKVLDDFKRIDILVNNAAVIMRKPAEDFTEEDWDHIMNINLKGLFFCCQIVGRKMIKQRKGKIINITSNASEIAMKARAIYATSKAGVAHMTRALALEWAKYNINVNSLGPGPTYTELNKIYFEEHPEDLEDRISSIPMNRMGEPADCAGTAVYLASEASDFVTGQNLLVDGGSTIW